MRLSSSWRFTRSSWLLRTTILLCLGVFLLSWSASGSEVSAVLAAAEASFAEQSADQDGYPIDGTYLAVFAQEDEAGQQLPKNAVLLRTLVLVLFFGLALGWILVSEWMCRRPEVFSPIRCCFHTLVHLHQRRGVPTLLGVFLL
jgi:hypothetical protein